MTHAFFRGPLPPPSLLEHYERVAPGAAERILVMSEEQQRARHVLEVHIVRGAVKSEARGQWFAFGTVLAGLVVGATLISSGHDISGLASMLTPLAMVAGAFAHTRAAQSRERELKRTELERARWGQPV